MGLFDDDFEPTPPPKEGKQNPRKDAFKKEFLGKKQKTDWDKNDIIKQELGLGNWSGKKFLVVVGLVVVFLAFVVIKAGGPTTLKSSAQDKLGLEPKTAAVIVDAQDMNYIVVDIGGTHHQIRLVGVDNPKNCAWDKSKQAIRKSFPKGEAVEISFDPTLGEQGQKDYQVYLYKGGTVSTNERLLQLGLATVREGRYQKTTKLINSQSEARKTKKGSWGC